MKTLFARFEFEVLPFVRIVLPFVELQFLFSYTGVRRTLNPLEVSTS